MRAATYEFVSRATWTGDVHSPVGRRRRQAAQQSVGAFSCPLGDPGHGGAGKAQRMSYGVPSDGESRFTSRAGIPESELPELNHLAILSTFNVTL